MHFGVGNIIFLILLAAAGWFFAKRVGFIRRNILLGRDIDLSDRKSERWSTMARVALGQGKMVTRPVAGIFHILIYLGFVLINIEILEIIIDGIFGTHRLFMGPLGAFYQFVIGFFEWLAVAVIVACVVFLIRRNVMRIKRFWSPEMKDWPTSDANIILGVEILLMSALLFMNAADAQLMMQSADALTQAGLDKYIGFNGVEGFAVSQYLAGLLPTDNPTTLMWIERGCWWFHIAGILAFLNYVPYSKHFHIFLAFPNTYYSNLQPKGELDNMAAVKKEVEIMFDPNADPYAAPPEPDPNAEPVKFGAKDVGDLNWKQLMDAYSCTECGRCTSECPANQTGKLLSPRKIMMDTRDRLEEVGTNLDKHGKDHDDGKALVHENYITPEELWACTSCNACVEACPVNINPLAIIVDLRRHLVMEESAAPAPLNGMFSNIENNGAPWQFAQSARADWIQEG